MIEYTTLRGEVRTLDPARCSVEMKVEDLICKGCGSTFGCEHDPGCKDQSYFPTLISYRVDHEPVSQEEYDAVLDRLVAAYRPSGTARR